MKHLDKLSREMKMKPKRQRYAGEKKVQTMMKISVLFYVVVVLMVGNPIQSWSGTAEGMQSWIDNWPRTDNEEDAVGYGVGRSDISENDACEEAKKDSSYALSTSSERFKMENTCYCYAEKWNIGTVWTCNNRHWKRGGDYTQRGSAQKNSNGQTGFSQKNNNGKHRYTSANTQATQKDRAYQQWKGEHDARQRKSNADFEMQQRLAEERRRRQREAENASIEAAKPAVAQLGAYIGNALNDMDPIRLSYERVALYISHGATDDLDYYKFGFSRQSDRMGISLFYLSGTAKNVDTSYPDNTSLQAFGWNADVGLELVPDPVHMRLAIGLEMAPEFIGDGIMAAYLSLRADVGPVGIMLKSMKGTYTSSFNVNGTVGGGWPQKDKSIHETSLGNTEIQIFYPF